MPEAGLLQTLRRLAPSGAGCAAAEVGTLHPLWPGEGLAGAVPRRLAEFSAGRAAARAAMAAIGFAPAAIPHGPDRAPVWPAGVIGSITHSASACLALVLPEGAAAGVGIDLEPLAPLAQDLWPHVLLPEEIGRLTEMPAAKQGLAAIEVFSAKEAAYKAQYRRSHQIIGFHAFRFAPSDGGGVVRFTESVPPFRAGDPITLRLARAEGHVLALAVL